MPNLIFNFWDKFFFTKQPTNSLGVFRIFFGLYLLLILLLSFHNFDYYFGPNGFYPRPLTQYGSLFQAILNFLNSQIAVWIIYFLGVTASLIFTLGFKTRISATLLYLVFLVIYQRNNFVTSGQEEVIMTLLFLSCFAPLGNSYSVDEVTRKVKQSPQDFKALPKVVWPLRLMQISIVMTYFFSGLAKVMGDPAWRDGTAFYYVSLFDHWFKGANISILHNLILSKFFTYSTLVLEVGFPLFIIFKKTRPLILVAVGLMHLFMILFFVSAIGLFALVMLISYILFIPSQTLAKFIDRIFRPKDQRLAKVFYDGDCSFCGQAVHFLQAVDSYQKLEFYNLQNPDIYHEFPQFNRQDLERELHLLTPKGQIKKGFFAFRYLTRILPGLYLLAPLFYFPGASIFGPKIYNWIADHRADFFQCQNCKLNHQGVCPLKK